MVVGGLGPLLFVVVAGSGEGLVLSLAAGQ